MAPTAADARQFPVLMHYGDRMRLKCPISVPWEFLAPHEGMAKRNHGQTLEHLAERGGLGPDEMMMIVEGITFREARELGLTAEIGARWLDETLAKWNTGKGGTP